MTSVLNVNVADKAGTGPVGPDEATRCELVSFSVLAP